MKRREFCMIGLSAAAVGAGGLLGPLREVAAAGKPTLSRLTISCHASTTTTITLEICAGSTGAAAGFSLQWMTVDDYLANDCEWSDLACEASFSGNARN